MHGRGHTGARRRLFQPSDCLPCKPGECIGLNNVDFFFSSLPLRESDFLITYLAICRSSCQELRAVSLPAKITCFLRTELC